MAGDVDQLVEYLPIVHEAPWSILRSIYNPQRCQHACEPSTWEIEGVESEVQGEANLDLQSVLGTVSKEKKKSLNSFKGTEQVTTANSHSASVVTRNMGIKAHLRGV